MEEKPLSEKTFKLGVGIGNQTKVFDNMFKREDVAQAVERLKESFNHFPYDKFKIAIEMKIDEIFGDLGGKDEK